MYHLPATIFATYLKYSRLYVLNFQSLIEFKNAFMKNLTKNDKTSGKLQTVLGDRRHSHLMSVVGTPALKKILLRLKFTITRITYSKLYTSRILTNY